MIGPHEFSFTSHAFDLAGRSYDLRLFSSNDSISQLTQLIRRAYRKLYEMDLRFVGCFQTDEVTSERISDGLCFIAVSEQAIQATITLYPPNGSSKSKWYRSNWGFGQFAVEPELQRSGLGSYLLQEVENIAQKNGGKQIILDTAIPALHLIDYYSKRGYEKVDEVKHTEVNYRSVIMRKRL